MPGDAAGSSARIHFDALLLDAHADTPTEFFLEPGYDFASRHAEGHIDLPRLREGGVDAQFLIAWVPEELAEEAGASFAHALRLVEAIRAVVGRTPGVRLATGAREVRSAAAAGDVAALIGIEGGHAIEDSLEHLRHLHALGARSLTLTWNNTHGWADACCSPPRHGGLSSFGRDVVRELNRLRMLVDLSHVAETTFWHALDVSEAPVIASHSCARALVDHPRNLGDEQLRAIATSGGVVGIAFVPSFLDARFAAVQKRIEPEAKARQRRLTQRYGDGTRARREMRAWELEQIRAIPPVPLARLVEHIEHAVNVAGVDHVALGSDFDGVLALPQGLRDVSDYPRVTELLVARGFDDVALRKILGQNLLRVLGAVCG